MSLWAGHKKDPFVNTIIGISSIKKPLPDQPPRLVYIHVRVPMDIIDITLAEVLTIRNPDASIKGAE